MESYCIYYSEPESPKYILECVDVQSLSGEYWEVTEEWFTMFHKKLKSKKIEPTETFTIESVEDPDGNETSGSYIVVLCASKQGSDLGWFIAQKEQEETGILMGVCPETYVNKIRESENHLNRLVDFVKRPNTFKDVSIGISS